MEFTSGSPGQTMELARRLGKLVWPGTVLVLDGPLGSGKTSFVQGLAKGLDIAGVVNSPTFTIVKEYDGRLPLFHFDLYRLEDSEEFWELGFEEYLTADGICALEWGEKASALLPHERLNIRLTRVDENKRSISLNPVGESYINLVKELVDYVSTGS